MRIRHRNQLKHRNAENPPAQSMPWTILLHTFRLPTQAKLRGSESLQMLSKQRSKRTQIQPRRLQVNPNLKTHEESAAENGECVKEKILEQCVEDHAFQDKIKPLEFVGCIYIYMLVAIAVEQHLIDGRWCLPKILQCIKHTGNV